MLHAADYEKKSTATARLFFKECTNTPVHDIMQVMNKRELDPKHFPEWLNRKEDLHNTNKIPPFSEGQLWWAGLGENVGVEINGKHDDFSRPVLVFKKLSNLCFLAVPLTSQPHEGSWYVEFEFRGKKQYAVLAQIRMVSAARLYNRMGKISTGDFKKIKVGFRKLIK